VPIPSKGLSDLGVEQRTTAVRLHLARRKASNLASLDNSGGSFGKAALKPTTVYSFVWRPSKTVIRPLFRSIALYLEMVTGLRSISFAMASRVNEQLPVRAHFCWRSLKNVRSGSGSSAVHRLLPSVLPGRKLIRGSGVFFTSTHLLNFTASINSLEQGGTNIVRGGRRFGLRFPCLRALDTDWHFYFDVNSVQAELHPCLISVLPLADG
jgi:hypothetical protein